MFEPALATRVRPMFAISAAAHAVLALTLVVPPLVATPEPPEPELRMPPFFPVATVHIGDAPVRASRNSLRRVNDGSARAATLVASGAAATRPVLAQPTGLSELLPAPTGEQPESPFQEADERSEPGSGLPGGTAISGAGGPGGCEGCDAISAAAPGVTPPVALESAALSYPELARGARVEGVVSLEAIIGADGSVRDVRVVRGAHPLLDPAAIEAVRRWRYRPARIGGRPVAVYLSVVVTFSLRNL